MLAVDGRALLRVCTGVKHYHKGALEFRESCPTLGKPSEVQASTSKEGGVRGGDWESDRMAVHRRSPPPPPPRLSSRSNVQLNIDNFLR